MGAVKSLFDADLSKIDFQDITTNVGIDAHYFNQEFILEHDPYEHDTDEGAWACKEINAWMQKPGAEEVLEALTSSILDTLQRYESHAEPGHDMRHMRLMVPSCSLIFAKHAGLEGHGRLSHIAALAHDLGRLLEARVKRDFPNLSEYNIPHEMLSFGLMRELLEDSLFASVIPKAAKDQILYAVLQHPHDNAITFVGQAVQRADRLQLVGPEGFLRELADHVAVLGGDIAPSDGLVDPSVALQERTSMYGVHGFFLKRMYSILQPEHAEMAIAKKLSAVFLMRAFSPEQQEHFFAAEMDAEEVRLRAGEKPNTEMGHVWVKALELNGRLDGYADQAIDDVDEISKRIAKALSRDDNAALEEHHHDNIRNAVERMSPDQRRLFSIALATVVEQQDIMEQGIYKRLAEMRHPLQTIEGRILEAVKGTHLTPA